MNVNMIKTSADSGLPKMAVQWLNNYLNFVSSSMVADSFCLRNFQLLADDSNLATLNQANDNHVEVLKMNCKI